MHIMLRSVLVVSAGFLGLALALDNGVGLTPAMGYNTWDDFRCGGINASNLQKVADAMVKLGLDKLGYRYVSLDDCWAKSRDPKTGVIVPDPKAFPDGMKPVADYVHSKGWVACISSVAASEHIHYLALLCIAGSSSGFIPIVAKRPASAGQGPRDTNLSMQKRMPAGELII